MQITYIKYERVFPLKQQYATERVGAEATVAPGEDVLQVVDALRRLVLQAAPKDGRVESEERVYVVAQQAPPNMPVQGHAGAHPVNHGEGEQATEKQINAIKSIGRHQKVTVDDIAWEQFGRTVDQLNKQQASDLIRALKAE